MDAEVVLINGKWILRRLGRGKKNKKTHFDHLPPRELRNPVEPDGCRSVSGLICNWSPLFWCNDYENTGWSIIFPSWHQNSTSGVTFEGSALSPQVTGTIELGGVLKQTRRWVTGGCQRGRGWQAAVTVVLLPHKLLQLVKLQASPGRPLLPSPYSPPSVHWSLSFFPPALLPWHSFVGRCFLSYRLSMMMLFCLFSSFTVFPQLPLIFSIPLLWRGLKEKQ